MGEMHNIQLGEYRNEMQTSPVPSSLHKLEIEGDAHAVDEHNALIKQLLVGDFGVDELFESGARANKFDGLGSLFGRRRKLIQDGKIKKLELDVWRNSLGEILELRSKKKVEALGSALVNRAFGRAKR